MPSSRALWVAMPVLLLAACWAGWSVPLNNDISWQYWIARQIRGGATLYRDIVEVNPPLWFWEAVPISALADWLRIDAAHLVVVSVMARAMLALLLVAKLSVGQTARAIGLQLVGLALILCLLPVHEFAEREHLMVIGAVPYTLLLARRREAARPIPSWLASCVGLYAAYGFAMKPHFALVPLTLELWLVLGLRRSWRPFRPETVALLAVAVVYVVAVRLFAPDYLRLTVPLARDAYGAFSPPFLWLLSRQIWIATWLLAILALATARRALAIEVQAAIVAAFALAVAYFVQGKGFGYHALPVTAMLGWALWSLLAQDGALAGNVLQRPFAALALALLVATGCLVGPFVPASAGKTTTALERLPAGSVVAVVSAHSALAFPLVETHRFVWPMRNIGLWTIPEIARHGEGPAPSAIGLRVRRQTLDMIAADLWCHPPDAILVDDPARSSDLGGTGFSYEAFLRSDPRLRNLLARYRPTLSDLGTTIYSREVPIAPRGTHCRAIAIRPDYR